MSSYSEGQTHQLMDALENAGFSAGDITRMGQARGLLPQIRDVVRGKAEVISTRKIIDLEADPFVPKHWSVHSHIPQGNYFEWHPDKVTLCPAGGKDLPLLIREGILPATFKGRYPFNVNLLDHLLAHPELIPHNWDGKMVYFWGTTYQDHEDRLCVRWLLMGKDGACWYPGWFYDSPKRPERDYLVAVMTD